ncbi:2-polyprenyl-6-methoxyphenol hydroxylase [Streptomyces spiralis]|uniref:2-polyprenyl-6-methoxyphenol hydroxylase n=1 Tax=Streptomyces spiralis TaxID=66376 RepID=A0A918ZXP4_9ACTN|nr:FAD-dependent monooxygenase [Streptomyces spiralis]GHE73369.1 2-polyprenyl-6-methoxyphenol hydroxylase [Streptomyces spiralis]
MSTKRRSAASADTAYERQGTAVVVGASLAGLMSALALSRAGIDVTMLERVTAFPRTGASLGGVTENMLVRLTGRARTDSDATTHDDVQSWSAIYTRLRSAVEADPRIRLRHAATVQHVGQDADAAWVSTADGRTYRAGVVIGADGHRSVVRRSVAPHHPDATFAGYMIWIGLADESAIAGRHRWPRAVDILYRGDGCLIGYPMAGPTGSVAPGARQLGWAWYDAGRNDLLREKGCVSGDVVQHTLRAADVPEATLRELADEADLWPSPWRDVIRDCVDRRAIIGTPIAEYVPDRLVNGRLALVGDAAHVPTPMTASGFGMSLADADAIADAVAVGLDGQPMAQALKDYERARLDSVRASVRSGQQFSRSFAGQAA